jgi:tRNA(Ile)-lysidine synthase
MAFMASLEQGIEKNIVAHNLFQKGEVVLVAVSGGLDSMVLLEVLAALSRENSWRLHVAHLNHSLRGKASERDQAFVARIAKSKGLGFHTAKMNVRSLAGKSGMSIEMAARKLRHKFLADTAKKIGARVIALGHHADDQVENFFLRLFRGGAGTALAGMKWKSRSPARSTIILVRPLLGHSKNQLAAFAAERKISWRQDQSNHSLDFKRNRIRNLLLPFLEKHFHKSLPQIVTRCMEVIGAEAELVSDLAIGWVERAKIARPAGQFALLPVALQRGILNQHLADLKIPSSFELIEFLRTNPNKLKSVGKIFLKCDDAGALFSVKAAPGAKLSQPPEVELDLARPGFFNSAAMRLFWKVKPSRKANRKLAFRRGIECFDAEKVGPVAHLRLWMPGDRFQLIGMRSAKKLQDIFADLKVPRVERHHRLIATTPGGDIFWVEGLRIGEKYKVSPETRTLLEWRWKTARSAKFP